MILSSSAQHALDWLQLVARWGHLITGAAWIGASFYFVWLNNHVRPLPPGGEPGVAGELWAIHGGAFYRVQKFAGAPGKLPETLHWFKWEAYMTWITGAALLVLVYWSRPVASMIDPSVRALTSGQAVGIGVGSIALGWLVYDLLVRSPLSRRPTALTLCLGSLLVLEAWGLCQWLSARAAYLHVGATMGTIMAANVLVHIIPGQRAMVDAMIAGREPPLERGQAGALRSLHNNYFTLPVLFVMVSNHLPFTYGHAFPWAILAGIAAVGVMVRHWFNLRGRGQTNAWLIPAAVAGLFALAFVTKPEPLGYGAPVQGPPTFSAVQPILQMRCQPCHSTTPTQAGFLAPPKGLVLQSLAQVRAAAPLILEQAVRTQVMPLGNLTGITPEERATLGAWLQAGAPE